MASNQLFELIHSLSPTEKGYIKKTAFSSSKGEEKSYILLFDAIANQNEYDEDKIVKKFNGASFIKNLSKSKNHLYHLILKRLAHYHEENVVQIKINGILNQAVILHKKGLYEQAIGHYEKALKMSMENEELEIASDIFSNLIDIYLIGKMGVTFPYEHALQELHEKLNKEHLVAKLNIKIAEKMFGDDFNKEAKQLKEIKNILHHEGLNAIDENDSFYAQWGKMCLQTHSYYLMGEHHKADVIKNKQHQFLLANKVITDKNPMRYVKHLANLINGKFNTSEYDAIPPLLKELKEYESNENLLEHVAPLQFSVYYIQLINYHLQTHQTEKVYEHLDESINWFNNNEHEVSDYFKIVFYDSVFSCYFLKGEFKKCIPWINKIVDIKTSFRKELHLSFKMNLLILHFELKNYELITYQIKSLYREITKHDTNQEATKYILRWFQDCLKNATNPNALKESAIEIKNRLYKMEKSGEWKLLTELKLFYAWLDSKITKESVDVCYAKLFVKEEVV